ncbi:MAG: hypothetical protein WBQ69_10090 [Gallionella sp.]
MLGQPVAPVIPALSMQGKIQRVAKRLGSIAAFGDRGQVKDGKRDHLLFRYVNRDSSVDRDILELYDAICKDPRNGGHAILRQIVIPGTDFPDWNIGFENPASRSPGDLPGFVEVFGGRLDKSIVVNDVTNAVY